MSRDENWILHHVVFFHLFLATSPSFLHLTRERFSSLTVLFNNEGSAQEKKADRMMGESRGG